MIFEFTEEEKSEIRTLSGIRLSNYIPVRVSINNTTVKIEIPKKGTAAFADSSNKQKIIDKSILYACSFLLGLFMHGFLRFCKNS